MISFVLPVSFFASVRMNSMPWLIELERVGTPANEKAIPHWKVSLGYGLLQAVVGLSVLWIKPLGLTPVIVLLAVWFTGFFGFGSFVRRNVASLRNPEML
jgi:hypothetical protein